MAGDRRAMDDDSGLRRLLADEWARVAAEERGVTRRLRAQAAEESTLVGTLLDAAEEGLAVAVRTTAGRVHRGEARGVGADFCAVELGSGRWVYVALGAVGSVRVEAGVRDGDAGTRGEATDRTLGEVLSYLAPERVRVQLFTGLDTEPVAGELWAVGTDVLRVRLHGPQAPVCHVNLAAVTEAVVDPA